ncbi:MAG: hypothetical protein VZR64_01325 [Eubacterium sp.]|nr:hypothetical protein [Eubacterium sp.]
MSYLDGLRNIILNEIEVGGKKPEDNDGPDESDNFMDDTDNGDDAPAETPTPDDTGSDDSEDSDNFMDDSEGGDDTGDDTTGESEPTDGDDTGSDDTGEDSDNFMDDSEGGDDTGDDTGGNDEGDTEGGDEGEDSDNFMDDGGEGGGSEDDSEGESEGSSEGDDDGGDESEDGNNFGIDKIEDELFSTLTPEQRDIKNTELKNQFIDLYSVIGTTLDRINNVSKSNENVEALGFVTQKLLELREMIDYIITKSYATKTYIENNIIYQQCISTLNLISEFINNIPNVNGDADDEDSGEYKGEPVESEDKGAIKQPESLDISDKSVSDYAAENESTDYNSLF